jgi:hypothetical protein
MQGFKPNWNDTVEFSPDDFTLKPHHIVAATIADGYTHFVIRLSAMTWSAKLIGYDGNILGLMRDERDAPLEDGQIILEWILSQPAFLRRIWELALEDQPTFDGSPGLRGNGIL